LCVLNVIKLSCHWHDFCDQLGCIYGKELIRHTAAFMLYGENCLLLKLFMGDGIATQSLYHRWSEKTLVDPA